MSIQNTEQKADERTAGVAHPVVTINPDYKLELVASKNNCRPEIENIKLDHSKRFGNVAVATNGRSMAIVPITHEGEPSQKPFGLVSLEALKASRKNKPLAGVIMLNSKLELPNSVSFPRPLESETGNYPNWEQCVPEPSAKFAFAIGLDPELLLNLAKAIGWTHGSLTLKFIDEMSPISVTAKKDGLGVLMPCRIT